MIEILAEATLTPGVFEVRARGGDDPAVRRLGPGTAEAANRPLVERREELGLEALGQESDLVEE